MTGDVKAYGYPCWMDLHTSDMEKSLAFYDALLGWKPIGDVDDGYTIIGPDGIGVAGITADANFPGDLKDDWRLYFRVEDARKTLDLAVKEGGKMLMDVTDMGDSGLSAAVLDPRENVFWL